MIVNVDGIPRREPMTQGQVAALCSAWVLIVAAAMWGDTDPHGVVAMTGGLTLLAIATVSPTVATRLALARRPDVGERPTPRSTTADIAEVESLMLARFAEVEATMHRDRAEVEARLGAGEACLADLEDRFDHSMSVLGGIAQGFAQEADRLRKTS